MTPVIAVLAHKNLLRVAQVVRYLSESGLHVCVHIDGSADQTDFSEFKSSLSDCEDILWADRHQCEWGRFSLVEATLSMSAQILEHWPDCGHVLLLSGDSLPTKPPAELISFLASNSDVDFIESVSVGNDNWVTGGLGTERFTLTFPFSWKKQRWLFDRWVDIQRKLHIKRRIPSKIRPHIGSQWWCLTRSTLQAILSDPSKPEFDAYFRKCWIPDESYFQTLARKYARKIESKALVYARFDHQGKPTPFYDDHANIIRSFDAFFVRKIWPGASGLYQKYLNPSVAYGHNNNSVEENFTQFDVANERRRTGRSGLYMHGRAPSQWHQEYSPTAAPYDVFTNFKSVFPDIDEWLEKHTRSIPHGRLFSPRKVEFSDDAENGPGGASCNAAIRDLAPENFLCNLIWISREQRLMFHYEPDDTQKIEEFLLSDRHANIHYVRYGWLLELMKLNTNNDRFLRSKSMELIDRERTFLYNLRSSKSLCNSNVWTLGEVLANPTAALSVILQEERTVSEISLFALPKMTDASQLHEFVQKLKNIGVDIDVSLLETPTKDIRNSYEAQANR